MSQDWLLQRPLVQTRLAVVSQGTWLVVGKGVSHAGAPDMPGGERGIEESRVMLLIGFL